MTVISSSAGTVAELDFMDSADSILDVYTVSHAFNCSLDILYQIVFIKMSFSWNYVVETESQ